MDIVILWDNKQKVKGCIMISFEPLRKILKERNISTYYLRNKCGAFNLDSKTIQRMMNDQSVSTYTINAICNILDCKPEDIMDFHADIQQKDDIKDC